MLFHTYSAHYTVEPRRGIVVNFNDFPEIPVFGCRESRSAGIVCAELLGEAVLERLRKGEALPEPRPRTDGERLVHLDPEISMRLALINLMREGKLSPDQVAERTNVSARTVRKVLSGETMQPGTTYRLLVGLGAHPVLTILPPVEDTLPYEAMIQAFAAAEPRAQAAVAARAASRRRVELEAGSALMREDDVSAP